MKKILTAVAIASAIAYSSNAQGLISFNNSSSAATKISTNSVVGGPSTGLTVQNTGSDSYYYALFYSAAATAVNGSSSATSGITSLNAYAFSDAAWTFAASAANGSTRAGQLSGSGSVAIPGIAGGGTSQFVVVGWSSNIGTTVDSLESYLANPTFNAWVGQSAVSGAMTLGDGSSIPTVLLFQGNAPALQGFTLGEVSPVPEPATMALAALGGASLLLFRRRK